MLKRFAVIAALVAALVPAVHAGGEWRRVAGPNFEVFGDAPDAELAETSRRLEQFRAAVSRLFPGARASSPVPTRVVVYRDRADFDRVRPVEWADGFLIRTDDVNYIALPTGRADGYRYGTVYHEYAHFLIENTLGRANVPPWLNEGVAEYYETLTPGPNGATAILGAPPAGHLALLRRDRISAPEVLFGEDYYTLRKQTKESAQHFYATAWLLVHWLVATGRFDAVMAAAAEGRPARQAIALDDDRLAAELRRYLAEGKFAARAVALGPPNALAEPARAMAKAEALAVEGDLYQRAGRGEEAERILRAAVREDPASAAANTSLGLMLAKAGKFYEARDLLLRATRSPDAGYRAFFGYGFALSRVSLTDYGFSLGMSPADAKEISDAARRAIALRPDFAESYNLFALVAVVRNENVDEALDLIGRALEIAPGNQTYRLRLAELRMRREEFDDARSIAREVLESAADDRTRLQAENTLRTINSLDEQMRAIRDSRRADDDTVTEAPLSDEEIARRREQATLEALNATLRRPSKGERRLLGAIASVECVPGRVTVVVRPDGAGLSRFSSPTLDRVRLISYDAGFVNYRFACGSSPADNLAVVTYRGAGEIVSIEFVPKGFRLL